MILHGAIIWYYMCISNKLCHIYIHTYMLPLSLYAIVYVYMDCVYGRYIIIMYHMIHLCSRKKLSCQLPQTIIADYKNGKPVRSYWMVHDGPIPPSLPAKCWSSLITLNMWTRHAVQQDGNNQGVLYWLQCTLYWGVPWPLCLWRPENYFLKKPNLQKLFPKSTLSWGN